MAQSDQSTSTASAMQVHTVATGRLTHGRPQLPGTFRSEAAPMWGNVRRNSVFHPRPF
jgi:hypothetical protein